MLGARAPYAPPRNERAIRSNLNRSGDFPEFGARSTAFLNKKLAATQRGNQYNLAREYRQAQESLINARSDEERQLSERAATRRQTLRGEGGRVRAGLRAAEQVYNMQQ